MKLFSIRRGAALGLVAVVGYGFAQSPATPPAAPQPTLIDPAAVDYGTRPVAYIYGNVPVTRSELAEFLIARGGYEKLELLVNKKIIDAEAKKRNISVTKEELDAELEKDLKGIDVSRQQFIEVVLSKYGKTYYEWMEDVVRPRLMLERMCREDVKVSDEDLKKEFDRLFGEKRDIQIIIWPKGDNFKAISQVWDKIRNDAKEFDKAASQQANPGLAAAGGHVSPIGRNLSAEEKVIEEKAFDMDEGQVSAVFMTSQGYMCIKCLKKIPADTTKKFETEKEKLHKAVYDLKVAQEIPKFFEKLKAGAQPTLLMNGPPAEWQIRKAANAMAEDVKKASEVQPAGAKK